MGRVFRTGKSEFKSKRQRSRVLIVEDHPMMRIGIRSLLDHSEHFTVCAECPNSRTALAQLRGDQPDMVILDITLPGGLDGIELGSQGVPDERRGSESSPEGVANHP
jgi:CheY-like chemotaxis protein